MKNLWISILAVAAAALVAAWFFFTHERVTETEYTGYQGVARFNRFLAAEMLHDETGIAANSAATLTPSRWLPDYGDTIVSRATSSIAVPSERQLLIDWVMSGGHLVLLPPTEELTVIEDFLKVFGFRLVANEPADPPEEADGDADAAEAEDYDYYVDLAATHLRIELSDFPEAGATLSDDAGVIVARREFFDGYVTLVAADHYFSNAFLADYDHARLLLDITAGWVDPGQVWFIYDAAFPALWQIIWDKARYVVVGALLLLLVMLWTVMPAFGPKLRPETPARRSIIEHVRASGQFVWRQHGAKSLARSSVTALLHEAEARHPGIGRLSAEQQARRIAQMTDVDPQSTFDALMSGDCSAREFTRQMELLQDIRNQL